MRLEIEIPRNKKQDMFGLRSVAKYWYTAERKNRYDETCFTEYKNYKASVDIHPKIQTAFGKSHVQGEGK